MILKSYQMFNDYITSKVFLKNESLNLINNLNCISDNYHVALDILKNLFENVSLITEALY